MLIMENLEGFVKIPELGLNVAMQRLRDKGNMQFYGAPSYLENQINQRNLEMHKSGLLLPSQTLRMLTPQELEFLITSKEKYTGLYLDIVKILGDGETSGEIAKDFKGDYWYFLKGEKFDFAINPDGEDSSQYFYMNNVNSAGVRAAF